MKSSQAPINNSAIVVLGMHRSGTSAMGGVLSQLGVDFGDKLYAAQKGVNEKGFWEHGPIVNKHDELLLNLASSWDDPRPLPEGWQDLAEVEPFRRRLMRIVAEDFGAAALWGLKDPRMSRLMPLWKDMFSALNVQPFYIIMVRNPLEVAASLRKRNGFSREKSLFIWWQHQALAEKETRGEARAFVNYETLLAQPEMVLSGLGGRLGLSWPRGLSDAMPEISGFLAADYRHHKNLNFERNSALETEVEAAYAAYVEAAAETAGDGPDLAAHYDRFISHCQTLTPFLLEHIASLAEDAKTSRLTLQKYYDCYSVKVAKRIGMLENYVVSLFTER